MIPASEIDYCCLGKSFDEAERRLNLLGYKVGLDLSKLPFDPNRILLKCNGVANDGSVFVCGWRIG